MNFKEQYKSTFSEIHASDEFIKRISEVENMKGINLTFGLSKKKKIFTAFLAAAIFTVSSAAAVNAGAASDISNRLHVYIDGKQVNMSDTPYAVDLSRKVDPETGDVYVCTVKFDNGITEFEVVAEGEGVASDYDVNVIHCGDGFESIIIG